MAGTVVVERTERIRSVPAALIPYLAELPRWVDWSPWEGLDPAMRREYSGEPGAVGSAYRWAGNRKAGAGEMRITAIDAGGVGLDLEFTRPFPSRSAIRFVLEPEGDATRVSWRVESPKTMLSRFFSLDKLIGGDVERGLRQLKRLVEAG